MSFEVLWGRPDGATPIDVHDVPVPIAGLAAGLDGFRLAVLSDLHFGRFVRDGYARRVVGLINAERPDAILTLGDLVSSRYSRTESCAEVLAELRAPRGVLGCLGNHEYYVGARFTAESFRRAGIDVLVNAHRRLRAAGGAELVVAGLDDHRRGRPDERKALAGVDADLPVILMCHNPDRAEMLPDGIRVDLMLSGHTHGGQIVVSHRPVFTRIKCRKYSSGLAQGPRCQVYTSRGVGMVALPLRINCRPEIPVIRLVRGK